MTRARAGIFSDKNSNTTTMQSGDRVCYELDSKELCFYREDARLYLNRQAGIKFPLDEQDGKIAFKNLVLILSGMSMDLIAEEVLFDEKSWHARFI